MAVCQREGCENEFVPRRSGSPQKYCTKECQVAVRVAERSSKSRACRPPVNHCANPLCFNFYASGWNRKYCGQCGFRVIGPSASSEARRKYRLRNLDRERRRNAAYQKSRRVKHKDSINASWRKRYRQNPIPHRNRVRNYTSRNPEYRREKIRRISESRKANRQLRRWFAMRKLAQQLQEKLNDSNREARQVCGVE